MNQFVQIFGSSMRVFWKMKTEEEKQTLLKEILDYANAQPDVFMEELEEVMFDQSIQPLPIALEALSHRTSYWGPYFVRILDLIYKYADTTAEAKPKHILSFLLEFAYFEKDTKPYVQNLVDRAFLELDSPRWENIIASTDFLLYFIKNPSIHNREEIKRSIYEKLYDKNWKVRSRVYILLKNIKMLPQNFKLSLIDKIKISLMGDPLI